MADTTTKPEGEAVERHNGSARAARWIVIGVLMSAAGLGSAMLAAGCGDAERAGANSTAKTTATWPELTRAPPADPKTMRIGASVFSEICHSCHTLLGKPHRPMTNGEPSGPNLDDVIVGRRYVEYRVHWGGIAMSEWKSQLSPRQFSAVVSYVASVAGRDVPADETDSELLATGEQVFAEHCNVCHSIPGRPRTGKPELPGADFTKVKPSAEYVERIVTTRYGFMERFRDKLTPAEIRAVAAYVQATAG